MELELIEKYKKTIKELVEDNRKILQINGNYLDLILDLKEEINTKDEKIKQLRDLSISLDKELTNMTKEVNSIEL